ncbi:MAG TPA: peptide chain release factor N(5)-glutamine methyltransferase [Rhodocyclaceae bacterium]
MSIAAALAAARELIPASEARLLAGYLLGRDAAWLAAHGDERLTEAQSDDYSELVACRAAGEPIAYLVGSREFYGREFTVTPAVLIPRPETELLVDLAKAACATLSAPRILDLGTGSGCVAVTLALELPAAAVTALDFSPGALVVAEANAMALGARVRFIESDWFAALGDDLFDLIVGNPPYVAEGDPHLSEGDLRFEPEAALHCGQDGLGAIRRIVAEAPRFLAPGGRLYFEHGYDQAVAVAELLHAAGFAAVEQHRDLAGIVRVSGGRL